MKNYKNIGHIDRYMRMLLSISLFVIGFFWFSGTITLVFLILSTLLAITGIFGICPPYLLLGIQRYNKDEKISRVSGTIFIVVLLSITIG
jgi:hypothetical protein